MRQVDFRTKKNTNTNRGLGKERNKKNIGTSSRLGLLIFFPASSNESGNRNQLTKQIKQGRARSEKLNSENVAIIGKNLSTFVIAQTSTKLVLTSQSDFENRVKSRLQ